MNIVVLAGGLSSERDVSLASASLIANALMKKSHKVCLVDVYKGLKGIKETVRVSGGVTGDEKSLSDYFRDDVEYSYEIPENPPSLEQIHKRKGNIENQVAREVLELCTIADLVYIGLHGGIGENGCLQTILECMGVKFTGSGLLGSVLAMDKVLSKCLMRHYGILTADWIQLEILPGCDLQAEAQKVVESVGLPCVVKPCCGGSSVGVSIAGSQDELVAAIADASLYERCLLAEKLIEGRELSIGILGDTVLPPVEIIPKAGFYNYRNKYQSDMTTEICPAELDEKQSAELSECALAVFKLLRLECYARMDFILSREDGHFYCLEANTLPGMTPSSLLPLEAASIGLDYAELCERIVMLGMAERANKGSVPKAEASEE